MTNCLTPQAQTIHDQLEHNYQVEFIRGYQLALQVFEALIISAYKEHERELAQEVIEYLSANVQALSDEAKANMRELLNKKDDKRIIT